MAAEISFRIANEEDSPAILAILNNSFRTPIRLPQWKWYSYRNPEGNNRVYVMLNRSGTVVGCYCVAPARYNLSGRIDNFGYANHMAVYPVFRSAFNFGRFSRFVFDQEQRLGTSFLLGPPNRNAYQPHKILGQWVDSGRLKISKRTVGLGRGRDHSCQLVQEFTLETIHPIQAESQYLNFSVVKSLDWMNWRYFERPNKPYMVFASRSAGCVSGIIVLKHWREADGYRKLHIMQMSAVDEQTAQDLLSAAYEYAGDADEINLWTSHNERFEKLLHAEGFVADEDAFQPLIARRIRNDPPNFAEPWNFCYGDADSY
jgi:L-amino acid N-acyltransferase YncA